MVSEREISAPGEGYSRLSTVVPSRRSSARFSTFLRADRPYESPSSRRLRYGAVRRAEALSESPRSVSRYLASMFDLSSLRVFSTSFLRLPLVRRREDPRDRLDDRSLRGDRESPARVCSEAGLSVSRSLFLSPGSRQASDLI